MIRAADPTARAGDVVHVYDKSGQLFGRGLYNPRSQIAVRMLTHSDTPVDDAFWRGRLEQAVALRRRLGLDEVTDAYRLVHAEGDDLSGLIVERYADCLVFEVFSLGMFQRYERIAGLLAEVLGSPTCLDRPDKASPRWREAVRADARIEELEGFRVPARWRNLTPLAVAAESPGADAESSTRLTIREHGLRYRVDVKEGHKTGFFCDQRDNRRRLARLARDATVLDLCCYSGGFSLGAKLVGGAREVTGVDLDEAAIAVARENANLNQTRIDFVHADLFAYVRQMIALGRQFDAVVLDPPKLVSSREEYDDGLRKYHDMNGLAMQAVRPGGVLLTCSCSGLVSREAFVQVVHRAGQHVGRKLQLIDQTGAAPDHPVMVNCPESAYLKALWLRVL
jgi:23S rRNA (cytosine1962-C5)-methyltransferase